MLASKPRVTYYQRKPRSVGNYSVEFIFDDVRRRLSERIEIKMSYSRFESAGLFKRLFNCIEAIFRQSSVNHVTGDINYIGIFLSRKKTVHTILDCVYLTNSSGLRHTILKLFWLTIPVRRSIFITAISQSTKNEILKYASCNPEKIKVIYVAISDRYQRYDKPFNKAVPRILQIGTAPNKNIPRLIEALEGIPCILEIVGKYSEEYERMLKEKNLQYEYRWSLSEDELIQRYKEADIVALASIYEGFGMPVLEAQATGRPVITSNVFSMPEVAGDAACLVDPFDTNSIREGVLKVMNDDVYRASLVANGFENVKRFSADEIALQYYSLYEQIAKSKAKF